MRIGLSVAVESPNSGFLSRMSYRQTELSSMAQLDAAKTGIDSEDDVWLLMVSGRIHAQV
jgi:hypothetical protein